VTNDPLVTVVIAVRNGERYLAEALQSVFAQNYRPLDVVVVDGQSDDRTPLIARSFPDVRYLRQLRRGIADAYNVGIDAAGGELIAFLSHDDRWVPDKLRMQVDHLLANPEVQYCTGRAKFFLQPGYQPPAGFRQELLEGDHAAHIMETLLVRKPLFDLIGNFSVGLSTAEDVDWFSRSRDRQIAWASLPTVLVHKRVHDDNTSLTVPENNRNLLQAVRQSIARKNQHPIATPATPRSEHSIVEEK
jgi:glycosyltransferase involved in cell wall biosynthesis